MPSNHLCQIMHGSCCAALTTAKDEASTSWSSAISPQIINIEVEDSLRAKSTHGGINYQFLKGAHTESRGISPLLMRIHWLTTWPRIC